MIRKCSGNFYILIDYTMLKDYKNHFTLIASQKLFTNLGVE